MKKILTPNNGVIIGDNTFKLIGYCTIRQNSIKTIRGYKTPHAGSIIPYDLGIKVSGNTEIGNKPTLKIGGLVIDESNDWDEKCYYTKTITVDSINIKIVKSKSLYRDYYLEYLEDGSSYLFLFDYETEKLKIIDMKNGKLKKRINLVIPITLKNYHILIGPDGIIYNDHLKNFPFLKKYDMDGDVITTDIIIPVDKFERRNYFNKKRRYLLTKNGGLELDYI